MWPFRRHRDPAIAALWQEIGSLNRHFQSLHHHLKAIAMNQQDELDTLSAIDTKLSAVESGIAGLQTKIGDLQVALANSGSFIQQPVSDALAKLKQHADKMAAAFAGTDSPSGDSPAVIGDGAPLVATSGNPVGAVTTSPFPKK